MNESNQNVSYSQKNQIKVKKITELMKKLFREEDEFFYKITLKSKHHETTRNVE